MSDNDYKFAWVADTSAYDDACDHIVNKTEDTANQVESIGEVIQKTLSDIPKVELDFDMMRGISSVNEMQRAIDDAFNQINRVVKDNEEAIQELDADYNALTRDMNKFANVPSMREHYNELKQQREAVIQLRDARKQAIAVAKEEEAKLKSEKKALTDAAKAKEEAAKQTQTLRQRIKELEAEAAALVAQAHEEGRVLDQNSGRYREIIEELGRLKDIRGDIQKAGNVFANDENHIAGVIQGLSGLSGAYSVAQGALGLFGSENEKLNEIMLKVQSIMAITIGLQQVQQVLNKDSAFSLVTLNALKKLFGKHTEEATEAIAAENDAIEDNINKTEAEVVEKEKQQAADEANTVAKQKNSAATKQNAAAQSAEAVANKEATATQNAHTGALVTGTFATKTLTAATKLLKLALISTGIGALIVLVGELVSWVTQLFSAEDEATKKAKELQEVNEEGAKVYAKNSAEIKSLTSRIENFNGTQKQEKQLLKEVNDKYGEQFGYVSTLQEAKELLAEKGDSYCKALEAEAIAQAYLNKYVEAYLNLLQVQQNVKDGVYHHWYRSKYKDAAADRKAEAAAQADVDRYLKAYEEKMQEAQQIRQSASIGGFTDPSTKKSGGSGKTKDSYDPKKAAAEQKKLLNEFKNAMTKYVSDTNAAISQAAIDSMEDGYYKEINAMHKQMNDRRVAWEKQLDTLAIAMRDMRKAYFLTQKGATEEAWDASEEGQRTVAQWKQVILLDPKTKDNYEQGLQDIDDALYRGLDNIRQKYFDQMVNDFGTYEQKFDQLSVQWQKKIGFISTTFPDFLPEAIKQMEAEFASLKAEDFKKTIDWDVVFGNLEDQSLQSLQYSLDKVKAYFDKEGKSMSVEQVKIFQEAIRNMEDEIASRNPFTALHKSFKDVVNAKDELKTALAELATAQQELTSAQSAYNSALRVEHDLRYQVNNADREDETDKIIDAHKRLLTAEQEYQQQLQYVNDLQQDVANGELAEDAAELAQATETLLDLEQQRNDILTERNTLIGTLGDDALAQSCLDLVDAQSTLTQSESTLTSAQQKNTQAEQKALSARNNVTKSYKNFATNLKAAGQVATDVGERGSKLARVFSDDIADSIDKALDFIDEIFEAASEVIDVIGDVGKTVAKSVDDVANQTSEATQGAAKAAATSISMIEKASVILTVISAALQIATAIANLFNNDDKKQKEIERLQQRIDQLQWELDNQDMLRLQSNTANALEKLKECYAQARAEVVALHGVTAQSSVWSQWITAARHSAEIYGSTIEKIADYWASVGYSADKALGSARYDNARAQLENLAEQQLLVYQQMNAENSKKKTDSSKIQEYQNQIAELAEEMASIINEMMEDIIGYTAEDLAKTLGDAFIDAAKAGEDAMKAWGDTVNDIVADILKTMMIQQIIEPEIGKIFDKYKSIWFSDEGYFNGFDAVTGSMQDFADDINGVSELFSAMFDGMPDELKEFFLGSSDRTATSRGIATASQDSVDENNARLTVIQSHTYSLVQGVAELNATGTAMLEKLTSIDSNTDRTADAMADVKTDIRKLKNAVDDITTQGLKLKS